MSSDLFSFIVHSITDSLHIPSMRLTGRLSTALLWGRMPTINNKMPHSVSDKECQTDPSTASESISFTIKFYQGVLRIRLLVTSQTIAGGLLSSKTVQLLYLDCVQATHSSVFIAYSVHVFPAFVFFSHSYTPFVFGPTNPHASLFIWPRQTPLKFSLRLRHQNLLLLLLSLPVAKLKSGLH